LKDLTYWKNKNKILLIRIVATRGDEGLRKVTQKSITAGCTYRGTPDELLAIETAAKANSQTMSEFIRGKLLATEGE
jgi:hypothetical protein